jgi:hypothetical protein
MFKVSDMARAKYLLQARADGKFRLLPFVRHNKTRHAAFGIYMLLGAIYFAFWGTLLGLWFFIGLCAGLVITELSWLRGRNKGFSFMSRTTDWAEVTRIANGN